jgi:23S rRNA (cytidine1920-2'-O)/16S rRNA (cytidine1409-2'-O)-methyltransferase
MSVGRDRLDRMLTERGMAESREKAQALIMAGEVLINGQKAAKSGQLVHKDAAIEVLNRPRYVSRGGLKLEAALETFKINPTGMVCLDIGSSTGGFTDCLLQQGAARVYAIDCGTAQLDWKLRNDPRVVVQENKNARHLCFADIGEFAGLAVCDVSFISAAGTSWRHGGAGEAAIRSGQRASGRGRDCARSAIASGGLPEGERRGDNAGLQNQLDG